MKASVTNSNKQHWLVFPILLTAFALVVGCTGLIHHPDPLAGWKPDFNSRLGDQAIEKDCQAYIQNLSPKERQYMGPSEFFEDGAGQHAVRISILLNGTEWAHILIYDKDNKRIRVIKYAAGQYRS